MGDARYVVALVDGLVPHDVIIELVVPPTLFANVQTAHTVAEARIQNLRDRNIGGATFKVFELALDEDGA